MSKKVIIKRQSFYLYDYDVTDQYMDKDERRNQIKEQGVCDSPMAQFQIQMFGMNEAGKLCSIKITDYRPFFYVQVPQTWTQSDANQFLFHLRNQLETNWKTSILTATLGHYRNLYKFEHGNPEQFVQITFANMRAFSATRKLWAKYESDGDGSRSTKIVPYLYRGVSTTIFEGGIPPLLRFFHIYNISPSGWVEVRAPRSSTVTTWCDYEYTCTASDIHPLPAKHANVPLVIMSMDIEADSTHGAFPQPKKTYRQVATQIVDEWIRNRMQFKTIDAASRFLIKAFSAAFSHCTLGGVQSVNPKHLVSIDRIQTVVREFTQHANSSTCSDTTDRRAIQSFMQQFVAETTANDSDCDGDGGDEEEEDHEVVMPDDPDQSDEEENNDVQLPDTYDSRPILIQLLDKECSYDHLICNMAFQMQIMFPPLHGDHVTFIGFSVMRMGDHKPFQNVCITSGECDPIPGVELIRVPNESEIILEWRRQVTKYRPSVMTGYNIFGFDYEFLFQRSLELKCAEAFLQLSANIGEPSYTKNYKTEEIDIETTAISIASGELRLRYFKTPGTIQLDMMSYFRKEFNFGSYKLDDVASEIIQDTIYCIRHPGNGTTEIYTQNITGLNELDYVHILLPGFATEYYGTDKKFQVSRIDLNVICPQPVPKNAKGTAMESASATYNRLVFDCEIGNGPDGNIMHTFDLKWGMAKDDMPIPEMQRMMTGNSAERALIAKYCVQDCNLVQYLLNKVDVITGYFQMSDICSVPSTYLVFRGQSIKSYSFMASECRKLNVLMPDLTKTRRGDKFEGAVVLVPKVGMYLDTPVGVGDYSALYPSLIISQNYAHGSKIWTKDYDLNGNVIREHGERNASGKYIYDNMPGYTYINTSFDIASMRKDPAFPNRKAKKTIIGKRVCRWAQFPDGKKAILPTILSRLLAKRKATKKEMKVEKNPFMKNILDKRQNSYKITANSLYGQCGGTVSSFYEPDIAASTTASGRMMIMYARNMAERIYGNHRLVTTKDEGDVYTDAKYVYGDTDSVFFCFYLTDATTNQPIYGKRALKITIELSQELTRLCSMWLKAPMDFAYEKTLFPFVIATKKRYAGLLYETNTEKCSLKIMGLSIKRRDSCNYTKEVFGYMLNQLMSGNYVDAVRDIKQYLRVLSDGNVPIPKLTITKALRGYYINPQSIAHKVLADRIGLRDPGSRPKPGDRMKFIHVVVPERKGVKLLQGDKIETVDFMLAKKLPIDYQYYITNQLLKPISQIMALGIQYILNSADRVAYERFIEQLTVRCSPMTDTNLQLFNVAREKYCMSLVKKYLFTEVLNAVFRREHHLAPITSFFSKK